MYPTCKSSVLLFLIVSFIYAFFSGKLPEVNNSIFKSTENAVNLCLTLLGTMCLWCGIIKIAMQTSLVDKLIKIFKPLLKKIFPDINEKDEVHKEISMNIIAVSSGVGSYNKNYVYANIDVGGIIGGIFIFELDNPNIMQIAQFYIVEEYRHMGIGRMIFEAVLDKHSNVHTWYVDTILEEDHNVNFYKQAGFVELEKEEEHEGLSFITLIKKR